MKTWKILPLALGVLLAGCASFNVRYDYDTRADYTAYRTFDWYAANRRGKVQDTKVDNPIMDRRVASAVEQELTRRGFQRETAADPDFLVAYYPIYRDRKYRTMTHLGWGSWGFRPFGIGIGTTVARDEEYREGTIVVEIVDFKTNQMVWHAAAEGALTELGTPENADETVQRAVRQMLDRFPPTRKP